MCQKKVGKFGQSEVTHPLERRKKGSPPHTENAGPCSMDDTPFATSVGISLGESKLTMFLKQVIEQTIRDFLCDPQNSHIIKECVTQLGGKESLPQSTRPTRDISNNEIIRPRDLPQATGLSKTNIWRLERAGLFVKKLKLSNGCVGYYRADVQEWLADRQIMKGEKP